MQGAMTLHGGAPPRMVVSQKRERKRLGKKGLTYRTRVPNAATTTVFGCQDICRPLTRSTDMRNRATSVTMSMTPMASQRGNCDENCVSPPGGGDWRGMAFT